MARTDFEKGSMMGEKSELKPSFIAFPDLHSSLPIETISLPPGLSLTSSSLNPSDLPQLVDPFFLTLGASGSCHTV